MAYNERRNERPSYGRNEGRGDRRSEGRGGAMSDETTRKLAAPQQTQCRFCRRGEKYVDYKDIETLAKLLTHRGKIYSRKRSGNCAGCQRKVKRAIKRARFMALLPFTA
jgi:small subunit ribosomal protein S18